MGESLLCTPTISLIERFEALHAFPAWSEELHVVWIQFSDQLLSSIYIRTYILKASVRMDGDVLLSEQLHLQLLPDCYETFQIL